LLAGEVEDTNLKKGGEIMPDERWPVAIGDSVTYIDENAVGHAALVTAIHYAGADTVEEWIEKHGQPGVNLTYVSDSEADSDPYGRQLKRATSVVHQTKQSAKGNFWDYR